MRKVIAAINMSIDGFCDHTSMTPGADIHDHYTQLLNNGGVILYGRTTYHLMEYWRPLIEDSSQERSMNDFAHAIHHIPKIVFSHTLSSVDWSTATLSELPLEEKLAALKQEPGKDILVGSRSLINALLKAGLVDELQLCVHPVIVGTGLALFYDLDRTELKLVKTKQFEGGAIILYYGRAE